MTEFISFVVRECFITNHKKYIKISACILQQVVTRYSRVPGRVQNIHTLCYKILFLKRNFINSDTTLGLRTLLMSSRASDTDLITWN